MFSPIKRHPWRSGAIGAIAAGAIATGCLLALPAANADTPPDNSANTTTPIKHVVVLFDENVSFDHYFATYPNATNTDGTLFTAAPGTPSVNNEIGATIPTQVDSSGNPLAYTPQRLTALQALTTSQNHNYKPEQTAEDYDPSTKTSKMDGFITHTQNGTTSPSSPSSSTAGYTFSSPSIVMDYYDGNTVTAEWNYAQNYAMSDNSWDATYGPSTQGALSLASGQTHGATPYLKVPDGTESALGGTYTAQSTFTGNIGSLDSNHVGTIYGDQDPAYDDCSSSSSTSPVDGLSGKNVGDLLSAKGVTWGWFQGGFAPSKPATTTAPAQCNTVTAGLDGEVTAYSAHHNPFEYYQSTANPHHLPPSSLAKIGSSDQANHQYDLSYFNDAVDNVGGATLPAVSYLKAPRAEDGHPGNSDPLDEQLFLTNEINQIESSSYWPTTAIVIAYDDSDGWFDHVAPTISNASNDSALDDQICASAATDGVPVAGGYADRCGPSQRLPMIVISPYAKKNYVDHTETNQSSILTFIEDNWSTGRIGDSSFDATAGSIDGMFDWNSPQQNNLILNADGSVNSVSTVKVPAEAPAPTVNATATGLSLSSDVQVYGTAKPAKATVSVTGGTAPLAGTVSLLDGTKAIATVALSNGVAHFTLPKTFAVGTHHLSAAFASSSATSSVSSSAEIGFAVAKATATTGISYKSGKITVSVKTNTKLTVNGTAKVYDGKKVIKTAKVIKGKVAFKVKLKKGTHKLHAVFATTKTIASDASKTISVKIKK